jgi:site-specific recombinase XerD
MNTATDELEDATAEHPDDARASGFVHLSGACEEEAATPANTRRTYRSRLALFASWCAARGARSVPVHPEVLRQYLLALAHERKSFSTIKLSRAAIVKAHQVLGHEPPDSVELRATLDDLRRALNAAGGIHLATLKTIVAACASDALATRDRALLLVTYFAGLRRAQSAALDCEVVRRDAGGYLLRISHPERSDVLVRLPAQPYADLCPVRALDEWLAQRDEMAREAGLIPGRGPLFVALHRGGRRRLVVVGRRISPEDVGRILKRRAKAAGIDAATLSAEDLRAGPKTEPYGAPAEAPRARGRVRRIRSPFPRAMRR